jgi:quercetin dioxygenase-like cupin family protein
MERRVRQEHSLENRDTGLGHSSPVVWGDRIFLTSAVPASGFASSPVIYFHSPSMTFAHYDFKRGASIHEHFHPQEEVYEVIEGELDLTIDGVTQIARAGLVAIVPANALHSVKALTDGRVIIVDYPARHDFD